MSWCPACGSTEIVLTATGHALCKECGYIKVQEPPYDREVEEAEKRERLRQQGD